MGKVARVFEELTVYREALEVDAAVYAMRGRLSEASPGLWDQIDRSAGSVADNIAEGFGRETRADFRNFLRYSRASAMETRSQLYRAAQRRIVSRDEVAELIERIKTLEVRIRNFQTYLSRAAKQASTYESKSSVVREPFLEWPSSNPEFAIPAWWDAVVE